MKIYILVCINEDHEVLSAKPYKTLEEAQKIMRQEYEAERSGFYTDGTLTREEIGERYAWVTYGEEYFYDWTIKTAEL